MNMSDKRQLPMGNLLEKVNETFGGFDEFHAPVSYLKETFRIIWEKEYKNLDNACKNRFRMATDFGHYLCRYWQMLSGNFEPRKYESKYMTLLDDNTENISNLPLIKRVEQLFKSTDTYIEYQSQNLENHMFGNKTYLEDNAFSTGHQSVNVYGLPEKRYEIRSEDIAVDIQIHKLLNKSNESNGSISIKQMNTEFVEFSWLKEKSKKCPYDQAKLLVEAVPILKKTGKSKKLNMLICSQCGKKYLIKDIIIKVFDSFIK